jgi:hypothetical protein
MVVRHDDVLAWLWETASAAGVVGMKANARRRSSSVLRCSSSSSMCSRFSDGDHHDCIWVLIVSLVLHTTRDCWLERNHCQSVLPSEPALRLAKRKRPPQKFIHFDGLVISFSTTKLTWQFASAFPVRESGWWYSFDCDSERLIVSTVLLHEHPSSSQSNANQKNEVYFRLPI